MERAVPEIIYMDYNATTPVLGEVLEEMLPFYREFYGNPSSAHVYGREPKEKMEESRERVAKLLGCRSREVVFTSGGTESNNAALKGAAFALRERGRHIVTSSAEHHAVLHTCHYLEKRFGFRVTYLPVDAEGVVDPGMVAEAITPETVLVTVMMANNETGTLNPVKEIGRVARRRGVLFHTDAVQAVGKVPVNVEELSVDLLSVSAHKIYGPKGAGALYVREGVAVDSLMHGGGHEGGLRAGTENIPGIAGLGKAADSVLRELSDSSRKLTGLRDSLWQRVEAEIPDVRLNGHPVKRLPNTASISFARIEGESAMMMLDGKGIALSTGSACSSEALEPSHVLTAMGVDDISARGTLRFSLGRDSSREQIDQVMEHLPGVIARLREMSPL